MEYIGKEYIEHVLITGAYGFLGKYIIDEFKSNGYKVTAFGRKIEQLEKLDGVRLYRGDFTNLNNIVNATKGVDYVIHAGALSTIWGKRNDFINTNVHGTANVIKACNANKVKKLVYISSPSMYCSEYDRLDINENNYDENNKMNYYIESKIRSEKLFNHCNVPYTIIRPRGLFGVGDTSIVPRLLHVNKTIGIPLFNEGKNIVDMTCVENVAYTTRLAIEHSSSDNKTYNITNGEPTEFKDILEKLLAEIGEKPKYLRININTAMKLANMIEFIYKLLHIYSEPPITKYTICTLGYSQTMSISKAKADMGYKPKISLKEGIVKYANAYRQNR